jgi:N-acetylglucosaminyl-diphospho-decaprenol L-rhamnosyltransferase
MPAGSIHAIIVNYRTPELTAHAVTALLASHLPHHALHVTIVDNGSGDDSPARLKARFPDLPLIVSGSNLGFAGGNNLALRNILDSLPPGSDRRDTFVLLVNSDVVVEPEALAQTVAFMEHHPEAGIVGPRVVLPDGRLDLACRRGFPTPARAFWKLTGLARLFPRNPRFSGYNLTHLDEFETTEVDSVVGAFMLLRVAAIDAAGLLDEGFFMYGEDLDWAYRIKAHGWRVFYYPVATVLHLKGATSRRQSYRMIVEFYRAMWRFHRKHYAPRSHFLINWLVATGIVARGALALGINLARPGAAKRVS